MADAFGAASSVPVAQTRNWKAYGITALAGVAGVGTFVWFMVHDAEDGKKPVLPIQISGAASQMPERKFEAPKPPPPQPAPTPIVAPPPPIAPIIQEVKKVPPLPPEPMKSMFAMGSDDAAMQYYQPGGGKSGGGMPAIPVNADIRPGSSDGIDKLGEDARQGLSAQKNRWLMDAGTGGNDYVLTPKMPPISRFMLQAGTIIAAVTLNEVNSDLPGDVVALINRDVVDTPTGTVVLIPASAKLYGRYSDQLSYGQRRSQIAWTRILFPDGSSQNIGSMIGTDAAGAAGIEGDVDRHVGDMALAIGGTAFFSVLSQAGQLVQGGGADTVVSVGAAGGGGAAASIGQQMITRELNRPNTLTVPAGSQVAVMLSKDIALPPYQDANR